MISSDESTSISFLQDGTLSDPLNSKADKHHTIASATTTMRRCCGEPEGRHTGPASRAGDTFGSEVREEYHLCTAKVEHHKNPIYIPIVFQHFPSVLSLWSITVPHNQKNINRLEDLQWKEKH